VKGSESSLYKYKAGRAANPDRLFKTITRIVDRWILGA
jgi:hypothetical protein